MHQSSGVFARARRFVGMFLPSDDNEHTVGMTGLNLHLRKVTMRKSYEELRREVRDLQTQGELPTWPTSDQRADWGYGNTVIENANVTFDMAQKAVSERPTRR
jgi:hypothetical protein